MQYNKTQKRQVWQYIGIVLFIAAFSAGGYAQDSTSTIANFYQGQGSSEDINKATATKLKTMVVLKKGSQSLVQALQSIARQAGLKLSYSEQVIPQQKKVTIKKAKLPAEQALWGILDGTGYRFGISASGQLVLVRMRRPPAPSQQETITGTVTDGQTGQTLPGVNILVKGTSTGTSTDTEGQYELTVESLQDTLVASYIGFQTQDIPINGRAEINIEMQSQAITGEEMVVVGYGTQESSDVTGSISSVKGEDIQNVQTENVAEALQGQAAGALITQSSGEPGSGMDVMIRGASTLGNTDPLYVVDGIPTEGDLSSINVSNIESIEILKDASATAIYGSRASNGVVMITTQRGSAGDTQVQFNARTGISNIPEKRRIDVLNSSQFHEFSVDAYQNADLDIPLVWQEPYLSENLQQDTDWQDELFRQGAVQNYNLTVSGGNENAIYSFSSGYLDEKGIVVSDGFERLSFRVNTEFYIGKNDQLKIGENISLSQTNERGAPTATTFGEVYQQTPTIPLRCPDKEGGFCSPSRQTSPGDRINQVALLHLQENNNKDQRLLGTAYAEYNFFSNLMYRLNLSADLSRGNSQLFNPLYDLTVPNPERDLDQSRSENSAIIIENTLNYNDNIFNDLHEIEALVGYTQEKREFNSIFTEANGFPSGNLRTINAATGQKVVSGGATASALRSFLGRIQYNYDERYRAQFAIRRDGSSRFGKERRWGTFPSGSVGWSIHNESFMSEYDNISRLTLRGSWGITGSQQIPDFAAIPTVQPVANYTFGGALASGSAILRLGNSNLQWQETKQLDIGLDVGLFNNRLGFIFDYYQKNTSNILLNPPVVTTSGIRRENGPFQNIGEVKNNGLEFTANYQGNIGNFSFQIGGNISTVNNEVLDLGVDEIVVSRANTIGDGKTITKPGSEIGAFYGYISEGPFRDQAAVDSHAEQSGAAPGDLKFSDLNGDGVIDPDDQTIIGSPFPDFFYGLNLNMNYQNWGLRVQVDGVQGRDIMAVREDNDITGINNVNAVFLDRWTQDNRNGTQPRATANDPNANLRSSSYLIRDGSYLAIRNLTLSYNFSPSSFDRIADFNTLRLYVTSSNIAWFTPYDGYNPELGAATGQQASLTRSFDSGSYPIARTLEVGIDITF